MNSQVTSIIQLMKSSEVFHTIKIENLTGYEFTFDSIKRATLHLTIRNLNMYDLDILVSQSYDSYVLTGTKRIKINDKEKSFAIPARVFKHMAIKENGETAEIYFSEDVKNATQ